MAETLMADGDADDYTRIGALEAELYANYVPIDVNNGQHRSPNSLTQRPGLPPVLGRISTHRGMMPHIIE